MPIFRYFAVMGPVLLGLLWLADAKLPPPGPLANSTNFYGLQLGHVTPQVPNLTVASAPEPDMTSAAVLAAAPEPTAAPNVQTPNVQVSSTAAAKPATSKKSKRVARARQWRDHYAEANPWSSRANNQTRFW